MRGALAGVVVAACGHASAPVPVTAAAVPVAPDASPIDGAPVLDAAVPSSTPSYQTPAGPMPGAPGVAILRLPDPTRCDGTTMLAVLSVGGGDEPLLVLGLAISAPAPATTADSKAWFASITDRARRAEAFYQQRADTTTGRDHVEAEAHYVQLERQRVDAIVHMRPWGALRPVQPGVATAFCDVLEKNMQSDIDDADRLAATCRGDAATAGLTSGWVLDACRGP